MPSSGASRRKRAGGGSSHLSAVKRKAKTGSSRVASSAGSGNSGGGTVVASTSALSGAIVAFTPIVKALILAAEETGASGPDKKKAVEQAAESLYAALQKSVKELRGVPWSLIGPVVTQAGIGLIDVIVGLLNSLWGKVWTWLSELGGDDE